MEAPWTRARRNRLRETPLAPEQERWLRRAAPWVDRLPDPLGARLRGHVQVFLDEKRFQAVGGLDAVTEEMRVTVATLACVLLLGREAPDYFPRLSVVRIAPGPFVGETGRSAGGGMVMVREQHRSGESADGFVALSWPHVRAGAADPDDGENVVFHELAHQLDGADGRVDGAPRLPRAGYGPWARALGEAYRDLEQRVAEGRVGPHLAYAATAPEEFFAVATEWFFERPHDLREHEPEVYDQLAAYFAVDPAGW